MDKIKITESVELALEALRDLEEARRSHHERTIDLKIEVLRQALFNILELMAAEGNAG